MAEVEDRAWWGSLATSWPRDNVKVTQTFSPAHDLMGEQHSAHFRVLVLPLIDDGLGETGSAQAQGGGSSDVKCRGRWALPLGKIMPSKSLGGAEDCKAGPGSLAPQTRTTTRSGKSGMRSVDSVCLQAAFSRSCYAWGQGGSLTKDQGQAEMGVDIPVLTIPMALVDLCFCSQALSSRPSQPANHPLPPTLSFPQSRPASLPWTIGSASSRIPWPPLLKQGASFLNANLASHFITPWASQPPPTWGVPFSQTSSNLFHTCPPHNPTLSLSGLPLPPWGPQPF